MKMRLLKHLSLVLFCASSLTSCWMDTGDITEDDRGEELGASFNVRVVFKNRNAWPTDNQLAICAFSGDEKNPFDWKFITKQTKDDTLSLSLTGIDREPDYVSISLLNKVKQKVYNFKTAKLEESDPDMVWTIDLLDFGRVQTQFFNNCQNCHGGSASAAAGLYLTEGKTYNSLVNQPSTRVDGRKLVTPGSVSESFIVDVITGKTDALHYDHTQVGYNNETEDIQLLKDWISNLSAE